MGYAAVTTGNHCNHWFSIGSSCDSEAVGALADRFEKSGPYIIFFTDYTDYSDYQMNNINSINNLHGNH